MTTATEEPIPETLTITLRKPVKLGDEEYTELKLREPTAGEMLAFTRLQGADADIAAVSLVSGVPRSAVEKIGSRDLIAGAKYLNRFLQ